MADGYLYALLNFFSPRSLNNSMANYSFWCRPNNQASTYKYLLDNFNRHYNSNKAPFGIYLNANAWFNQPSTAFRMNGYTQFLDYLTNFDDVYVVSIGKVWLLLSLIFACYYVETYRDRVGILQGVEWMKNPMTTAQAGGQNGPFDCPTIAPTACSARRCYYEETVLGEPRNMVSCTTCPPSYPWTGNPTGNLVP